MLGLLQKDVIGETLDGHCEAFEHIAATEGFPTSLLDSSSFMAPIANFFRCKMDTAR